MQMVVQVQCGTRSPLEESSGGKMRTSRDDQGVEHCRDVTNMHAHMEENH